MLRAAGRRFVLRPIASQWPAISPLRHPKELFLDPRDSLRASRSKFGAEAQPAIARRLRLIHTWLMRGVLELIRRAVASALRRTSQFSRSGLEIGAPSSRFSQGWSDSPGLAR